MTQENKDRMISGLTTFVVMLLSIVLCSWLGYKLPNPPIEEEGMGVAGEVLGEIEGLGNNDEATFDISQWVNLRTTATQIKELYGSVYRVTRDRKHPELIIVKRLS